MYDFNKNDFHHSNRELRPKAIISVKMWLNVDMSSCLKLVESMIDIRKYQQQHRKSGRGDQRYSQIIHVISEEKRTKILNKDYQIECRQT